MSRRGDKNGDIKLRGQFIPAFVETRRTPAWKAMSMGARELYMTLKVHHFVGFKNNNGRIFLSERKAMEEMGVSNREWIRRWYRELQHYGFIVMTNPRKPRCRGQGQSSAVAPDRTRNPIGRLKGTNSRLQEMGRHAVQRQPNLARSRTEAEKQNPGRETTSRVDAKQRPVLDAKQRPPHPRSGRETTSISAARPGRETTSISRLTTGGGAGGSLVKKEQGKVPWSTPILEPVPGDYDRANSR